MFLWDLVKQKNAYSWSLNFVFIFCLKDEEWRRGIYEPNIKDEQKKNWLQHLKLKEFNNVQWFKMLKEDSLVYKTSSTGMPSLAVCI